MTTPAKENFAKWAPLLVALAGNIAIVAYGYGKLEQRLSPVELQLAALAHDKLAQHYVTRQEFALRTNQRDREMNTQNEWLQRIESKLDRLLERQNNNGARRAD